MQHTSPSQHCPGCPPPASSPQRWHKQSCWHGQGCPKWGLCAVLDAQGEESRAIASPAQSKCHQWAFLSWCLYIPGLPPLLQVGQNSAAAIRHISTFTYPAGTSNNFPSLGKAALFSSMLPVSKGSSLSTSRSN